MNTTESASASGIGIEWLGVTELEFVDNPDAERSARRNPLSVTLQLAQELAEDRRSCRVSLRAEVVDDAGERFKKLAATVQAKFVLIGESVVSMDEFMHKQGPVILMPFLRDAISHATVKSRHGAVMLPPMNVSSLLQAPASQRARE